MICDKLHRNCPRLKVTDPDRQHLVRVLGGKNHHRRFGGNIQSQPVNSRPEHFFGHSVFLTTHTFRFAVTSEATLHRNRVNAKRFQRLFKHDLLAIDLDSLSSQQVLYRLGRNRTEYFVVFADIDLGGAGCLFETRFDGFSGATNFGLSKLLLTAKLLQWRADCLWRR